MGGGKGGTRLSPPSVLVKNGVILVPEGGKTTGFSPPSEKTEAFL